MAPLHSKSSEKTASVQLAACSSPSESSTDVRIGEARTDGGWTAWSQVLVSHLLVINGFGYMSSFGLFQQHWETTFHRSPSDIAWVGSLQLFLLFFVGTWSGRAMDAGYFRSLLYVGCALQVLGTFSTSVVNRYWQLVLAQGITQGIGNGILFTPAVALVSTYFIKRRAFALGVAACGAPVGGVVYPILARQLVTQVDYAWVIRIMGFVMLFNAAVIAVLARPRATNRIKGPIVEWAAFREPTYALFAMGIYLTLWGVYIAYFYTSTYGQNVIHESSADSLIRLMVLNAVGVPGRLIPALLADAYFGPFNLLLPFTFISGIMLYAWMAAKDLAGFMAFVIIYGVSANAVQTLFPSTLSSLTTDLTKMGVRVGMVFTIGSIACLTGAPIAGALIAHGGGSYLYAQIFGGTTVMLGAFTLLAARIAQMRARSAPSDVSHEPQAPLTATAGVGCPS